LISAGIIWVATRIGQEQRWGDFIEYFRRINIGVIALTLIIFTIGHMTISLRWWILLKTQSIFIGLWPAVKLYFLGWFYNNFMPSSVGGDLVRAWYVTRHTDKKFEAALSVFVDRAIGLLSTLVIAIFFYSVFLRGQAVPAQINTEKQNGLFNFIFEHKFIFLLSAIAIAAIFCGLLINRRTRINLIHTWTKIRVFSINMMVKFKNAVAIYCKNPLAIIAVFFLTVLMQITVITGFWLLGRNMGITVSIKYYYVFFTLAWVVGTIPVSVGGVVVIEGFLVLLFTKIAGLEEPAAWAIALGQRAVWMITSLPGAIIHLTGGHLPGEQQGIHLPKDFSVDYNKTVD